MQPLSPNDPGLVGPYRTIAELGRGAMGRVLLGIGPDGRPVAVKLVREWLAEDEEFRSRFRREVAASQQVSGAYTAAVLEAGPEDSVPWLASEFLLGPTLRQAVETAGPLPEATVLRLAAGLGAALTSIHRAEVIHRDLKPGNVILAADGPRVIDFGIARAADYTGNDLTRTGGVIGTPGFMSPEQADSAALTAASDVFSLGSVLVMACTGGSPFTDSSTLRTLNNVVRAEPDLSEVPERVRRVAAECLARNPADRPGPSDVLTLVGPVAPSSRPWPEAVSAIADDQRRRLARLLDEAGEQTTIIDTGRTMMAEPRAPAPSPAGPAPQPPPVAHRAGGGPPPGSGTPAPPPPATPSSGSGSAGFRAAAVVACIAVIAVIAWAMTRDDEAVTGSIGNATESEASEAEETSEADEQDEETEAPQEWVEQHGGLALSLGMSDDDDACQYTMVDFDDIDEGTIYEEQPADWSVADYTDLIWDPCTDTDLDDQTGYTNYLTTPSSASGTFYDSGTGPTPDDCWAAVDQDRPELEWGIDTWSPENSAFESGVTLCLYTDGGQIVLAEVTEVQPEDSETWMRIDFEVAVWAWQ